MTNGWQFFLFLTLTSVVVQSFYSMMEMGLVSFNKVRLQYYVSKGSRRAKWISYLINHPTRLFGTTLIGVNTAMQFGSECSRRFYMALDLSPDWAPVTQIVIVLIFAELSPIFAARRFPENVAMLGIPLIYLTSQILSPVVWFLGLFCRILNKLLGIPTTSHYVLSRDELQKAIEAREEQSLMPESEDLDMVATNIFSLKTKKAKDLMEPLSTLNSFASTMTVGEVREHLLHNPMLCFLIYDLQPSQIMGFCLIRDLIGLGDEARVSDRLRTPWFISDSASIMEIIKQFRKNNQSFAVVLDQSGGPVGVLTLDVVIDEIFVPGEKTLKDSEYSSKGKTAQIDRTFSGHTTLHELHEKIKVRFDGDPDDTIEDLMEKHLGHPPGQSENVRIGRFELYVEEALLIGGLTVRIRTLF